MRSPACPRSPVGGKAYGDASTKVAGLMTWPSGRPAIAASLRLALGLATRSGSRFARTWLRTRSRWLRLWWVGGCGVDCFGEWYLSLRSSSCPVTRATPEWGWLLGVSYPGATSVDLRSEE